MSNDAPVSRQDPRELLKRLQEISPAFREYKPLALKIDASIHERFPEFERKALRTALHLHTSCTRYIKAVARATERFDFDGNVAGEVTEDQRAHAETTLKERFAAAAKRKKEQNRAEEAERRRGEKMQQLLERFSKKH